VISTDEKSQLQVLTRVRPGLPPGPGRAGRYEFEYERGGTVAYLAAYDVHRARLMGRVEPTTGIAPFTALADQVMSAEPYASARRVYWVAGNGSSRKGQASIARLEQAHPNATLVHLPVHASWLNQVEIVFSVVQRKVIAPTDSTESGMANSTTRRPGPTGGMPSAPACSGRGTRWWAPPYEPKRSSRCM